MNIPTASESSQQPVWASGEYIVVGTTLQIVAEQLCEAVDLHGGQRVLDVATGTGNTAIAAARRACDVTGVDYALPLLQRARIRAMTEGVFALFVKGDAEKLPFATHSFDVVLSTFGVMFAQDHAKAAAEMLRVCRPKGSIGMANWTLEGVFGESSKVIAAFSPPAPELGAPPALWGTAHHLNELFANRLSSSSQRRTVMYRYRSVEHYLNTLRNTYPPLINTFEKLSATQQDRLKEALYDLYSSRNEARDGTFVMAMEYLETVGRKKE
jgi:ubiquinone/menaquinone biosynthesis C-methylase UbiE